ncbi:MAG: hypothetical protein MRJ92_02780 [Nitrospira sp.]|nr:hypothetical protein [Nitrospira sp.]
MEYVFTGVRLSLEGDFREDLGITAAMLRPQGRSVCRMSGRAVIFVDCQGHPAKLVQAESGPSRTNVANVVGAGASLFGPDHQRPLRSGCLFSDTTSGVLEIGGESGPMLTVTCLRRAE